VRGEVGHHRERLVGLAKADFVGEHDPALPMDEEASQSSGDHALLVSVARAKR
jgi:hypothetical protein